jgi:hypothetical protein
MSYVIRRSTAWLCLAATFIAGMTTGFALLAVILTYNIGA